MHRLRIVSFLSLTVFGLAPPVAAQALQLKATEQAKAFARENLIAWCIVPFDANKRGPVERVEMIKRLGMTRIAYDWRAEHIPTFEEEIQQYQANNIEFFAFWSWDDSMEPLIKKYGIKPQLWSIAPSPDSGTQEEKVAQAADELLPIVLKAKELGLKYGLYNHGDWGGKPENLVAVCEYLRKTHGADHVGIVYNFHHGHSDIDDFEASFALVKPYLHCLNLNGMADPKKVNVEEIQHKIRPIGSAEFERGMIQVVIDSGYAGPIGILDHRKSLDSEIVLKGNLQGLAELVGP